MVGVPGAGVINGAYAVGSTVGGLSGDALGSSVGDSALTPGAVSAVGSGVSSADGAVGVGVS